MSLASFCHLAAFGTSDVGRSSDGIIGSLSLDTDYFLDGYYADLGIQPVKLVAGRTVNVGPPLLVNVNQLSEIRFVKNQRFNVLTIGKRSFLG